MSAAGVVVAIGIIMAALYYVPGVATALMLVFGGLLVGIFFDALASLLVRWLPLSRGLALTTGIVLTIVLLGVFGWIAGPQIAEQSGTLETQIPKSLGNLSAALQQSEWGRALVSHVSGAKSSEWLPAGLWNGLTGAFSASFEIVGAMFLIFVLGIYFSASPSLYFDGALLLFPPRQREHWGEILQVLGAAMRLWLVGRLITMLITGVLTTLALWAIHVPLSLTLGLIAGLLVFVPYIGAFVSAAPALLVALGQGPWEVLWVGLVFTAVHVFEGYVITPYVQKCALDAPPALLLVAQIFAGVLFGVLGLLFASPLAIVGMVLVQKLYVRETLGEEVSIAGEESPPHHTPRKKAGPDHRHARAKRR